MDTQTIQTILIAALPIIFAVVFHEIAHGWVARYCGDNTAFQQGRLSPNPIKHIDPIGTILVPIVLYMLIEIPFGWAKPVPITWSYLRKPRRDIALVAAAGPAANLVMAFLWALLLKVATLMDASLGNFYYPLVQMCSIGVFANIILMVFNLIPMPPLDGGRIASILLPHPWGMYLSRIEPFGFFILLALLATGLLWPVIGPAINTLIVIIRSLAGL